MTPLPLCFIISVSVLLCKSSIPVQGRVVDVQKPPGKFNETFADEDKEFYTCFSKAVGVANSSKIPDKQMTASSYYSSSYQPAYGRLNFNRAYRWCAKSPSRNDEWLQVDLGQQFLVCGVASQGNGGDNQWVTAFKLSYSQDGKHWTTYKDENGNEMEFHRYSEVKSNTIDHYKLKPFYARYIRFNPTKRQRWNCLRVEVYGSSKEFYTCYSKAVGVANSRKIPDKQLTASSYYSSSYQPAYGRLNFNRAYGWCAKSPSRNDEWLQVDLGQLFKVCGVATQRNSRYYQWVTAFKLSYSQDGKHWTTYKDENGNEMEFDRLSELKSNTADQYKLKTLYAKYIRFHPTKRRVWNCLRVEVYGTELVLNNVSLSDCGKKLTKRVVGGQHASPGEWRWHVEIGYSFRTFCGGSLLTPQWVITAAHCVKGKNPFDIEITLGQHTRSEVSGEEQVHSISKYIMHPQYDFPVYDFALIKLTKPATLNEHVATICLPESIEKLPVGTVLWQTGWGYTSNGGEMSDVLKELEVIIVPRDSHWRKLSYSEFLTTATQEGHGTCHGDSGGPVVNERNGRWYLEGVVSWVAGGCVNPNYSYDGQADVRAVLPWIIDTMKNN